MGRTVKDSKALRTMPEVYEIVLRPDGLFDVFHNGRLSDRSIPDGWLQDQLVKYGICGKEYHYVRREVEKSGKARLAFRSRANEGLAPELIEGVSEAESN